MNAHVLDNRHSVTAGLCDVHASYVSTKQAVSKLFVVNDGIIIIVRICRPCARALARNARLTGAR